jgi:hypothetical protein
MLAGRDTVSSDQHFVLRVLRAHQFIDGGDSNFRRIHARAEP